MSPIGDIGRQERAWRAAAVLSALWLVVEPLRLWRELSLLSSPELQVLRIGHGLLAAAALGVLLAWRRTISTSACTLIAFVVTAAGLLPVWAAQTALARAGENAALFIGPAAAMMIIATLAPEPLSVGLILIGALALESAVLALRLNEPAEPFTVLLFGAAAAALQVYRMNHLEDDSRFAAIEAEKATLGRLARVLLAVRDLSNTPLQVLVLELELLKQRQGADDLVVQRMETALNRLRELRNIVKQFDEHLPIEQGDTAIDSVELLTQTATRVDADLQVVKRATSRRG